MRDVISTRRIRLCALPLLVASLASGGLLRQAKAAKPIRIIVPFSAGSTIDALARQVAASLPEVSAYQAFVDNRSGAAGIIGTAAVARSHPDGYTILLQANGLTTTPAVRDDLPFDTLKDLAPITLAGTTPYAFIAPASMPYETLDALFEHARKSGERVTFGTSGLGSQSEFVMTQLSKRAGISFLEVPFRGQAEIVLGVMGDQVQLGMINLPSVLQQAQEHRIKLLATLTRTRTAATPDVPTLAECGLGQLDESAWYGFLAPAHTPPEVVRSLNNAITAALRRPEARTKLTEMGIELVASTPEAFASRLKDEIQHYRKIAEEENLRGRQP